RMQEGVRAGRPQVVEARSPRLADGVIGRLLAPAPTVEYDQHHRTALLHLDVSRASPAVLKLQPRATTGRRMGVWDGGSIVNQHGRPPRIGGDANRAFRVTPARFLLAAAVHPVDVDQFDPEI